MHKTYVSSRSIKILLQKNLMIIHLSILISVTSTSSTNVINHVTHPYPNTHLLKQSTERNLKCQKSIPFLNDPLSCVIYNQDQNINISILLRVPILVFNKLI